MKILSVPRDHYGSHNNLMKLFSKNFTLYGVYISIYFGFRLNRQVRFRTKKKQIYRYKKLFKNKKELLFRFQFYKLIGKSIIYIKIKSYFKIFFRVKNSFWHR